MPSLASPSPPPHEWASGNPHYAYYCYYMYANLYVLNQLREAQGLSTFTFRPHSGEAGELNHLHAAFLTARGINHGINLRKSPSLQYLYYVTRSWPSHRSATTRCSSRCVGAHTSTISIPTTTTSSSSSSCRRTPSTNSSRWASTSLSTDDPLMFTTKEPLMEEYCIAKRCGRRPLGDLVARPHTSDTARFPTDQVWRLSSCDLARSRATRYFSPSWRRASRPRGSV